MQSEAIDHRESWAARKATTQAYHRAHGPRLTLLERQRLLLFMDLLLVNSMLVIALGLWNNIPPSATVLSANYKWFVTLSLLWYIIGQTLDLYSPVRAASTTAIVISTSVAGLLTGLIYVAIPWLTPPLQRRFYIFGFVGLTILAITLWRALYARLLAQSAFERRVLIVGNGKISERLADELNAAARAERANPLRGTGYHILGFVNTLPVGQKKVLDPAHSLIRLIRKVGIDEVLVSEDAPLSPTLHEALLDCRELGIPVTPLAEVYARLTNRLPIDYASHNLRLIVGRDDDLGYRLYCAVKYVIDILLALVGIAVIGVLIPFVAVVNALTSPGPLFYRQQRVGRAGQPFAVIKFRTMQPNAETDGAVWASDHDDRVTPLGKWMRRMHIDELPQVINILRGEMSVVGPRPERPQFVGEISRVLPIYRARHAVKPGITGWAQIHYPYGDSLEDARIKLEYDLYYIQNASLALDLLIMLQTIPTMLLFKGQ